ncbi:hypothetical protein [Methanobacterium sp. ACI-7]|uniref:hypothetical protein n=1 Tax=unclassified Methanobacterium TaxID=2627676 RepID=UPI0039C3489C
MDNFLHLGLILFLGAFYIGLIIAYFKEPKPKMIYKYPKSKSVILIMFAVIPLIAILSIS